MFEKILDFFGGGDGEGELGILQKLLRDKKISGVAGAFVTAHRPIKTVALGDVLSESPTIDDCINSKLFRIASISKCITALALGKMVEEGLLNYNDDVRKFVPEFPKKNFPVTLLQLASHTAGIRGYRGKEFALNEPIGIEEGVQLFANDKLLFTPGQGYFYNSFGFVLLSLAMQRACGVAFDSYVKNKVLIPLGMHNTFAPEEVTPEMLQLRELSQVPFNTKKCLSFAEASPVNNNYKLAGGGYLSTVNDMVALGQCILDKKLLSKQTYQTILSSQKVKGRSNYYGLGFQVSFDSSGRPYVGHIGNGVGGYANFFVYPKEKAMAVLLINCTSPKIQDDLDTFIQQQLFGVPSR